MSVELGDTTDPAALVPGDVGAVAATVWALREYGDALAEAGHGLSRISTEDGWRGAAGDAFRTRFDGEPRKWLEAAECFHAAAHTLDGYASTLRWAQEQAAEAIRLWVSAEQATSRARTASGIHPTRPPGRRRVVDGRYPRSDHREAVY